MICIKLEFVKTDGNGKKWWKAILTDTDDPVSLNISGADVDNLNDNIGIAAGSLLITPSSNYIAFEDGVFTQKGEESPTPTPSKIALTFVNEGGSTLGFMYMPEPDPDQATTVVVASGSSETVTDIDPGVYVFVALPPNNELEYTGDVTEDTESVPGSTLYICNGDATFTARLK